MFLQFKVFIISVSIAFQFNKKKKIFLNAKMMMMSGIPRFRFDGVDYLCGSDVDCNCRNDHFSLENLTLQLRDYNGRRKSRFTP